MTSGLREPRWWAVGLIGLVALIACTEAAAPEAPKETATPKKPIEAVLEEHTDSLMALPAVVGTAQGECAGEPCIKILVAEKTPELERRIPDVLDGYRVEIVVMGPIKALPDRPE